MIIWRLCTSKWYLFSIFDIFEVFYKLFKSLWFKKKNLLTWICCISLIEYRIIEDRKTILTATGPYVKIEYLINNFSFDYLLKEKKTIEIVFLA